MAGSGGIVAAGGEQLVGAPQSLVDQLCTSP